MPYKTLIVHTDVSTQSEARTAAAIELARKFDAMLMGLAAGVARPVVDPYSGAVAGVAFEMERGHIEADLKAARAKFEALAAMAPIEREFRSIYDFPSRAMIGAAAEADLLVVGPDKTGSDYDIYADASVGDLIMSSGRPILVLPSDAREVNATRVLVAWKDTREARRALSDSLPFLQSADEVLVIEISEDTESAMARLPKLRTFLKRHGIEATVERIPPRGGAVEDQLRGIARAEHSGLLVAGGYGHLRLGEWLFGGVTRALSRNTPLPVLFSH